jgi:GT2 family glycosyltransferase
MEKRRKQRRSKEAAGKQEAEPRGVQTAGESHNIKEPILKDTTTIIIPNYNGLKFMEMCFESLEAQTYKRFHTLVVDNGSTDGSVEWLKEHESDRLQVIYLDENTGFSGAVNKGIQAADTKYVLLLNNDVRCEPDFVLELVRAISRTPNVFSVASKMLKMYEPDTIDSAGDLYTVLGWAFNRGAGESAENYSHPTEVFTACAGAAIYRREVFDEIGLFDEKHFAYLEDVDIGYRARIAGYRNLYCPKAIVYHVGSGTSGSMYNPFKVKLSARNIIYVYYKNMPLLQRILNLPALALGSVVRWVFFVRKGFGKDYLAGLAEGIKTYETCRRVPFRLRDIPRYIEIEYEMIAAALLYVRQRALAHLK